jgi:hypothetical protein
MFNEVANGLAESRGDEVAGVAEEDGGPVGGFRIMPSALINASGRQI